MREVIVDGFAGLGGVDVNYTELEVTDRGVPEFALTAAE